MHHGSTLHLPSLQARLLAKSIVRRGVFRLLFPPAVIRVSEVIHRALQEITIVGQTDISVLQTSPQRDEILGIRAHKGKAGGEEILTAREAFSCRLSKCRSRWYSVLKLFLQNPQVNLPPGDLVLCDSKTLSMSRFSLNWHLSGNEYEYCCSFP